MSLTARHPPQTACCDALETQRRKRTAARIGRSGGRRTFQPTFHKGYWRLLTETKDQWGRPIVRLDQSAAPPDTHGRLISSSDLDRWNPSHPPSTAFHHQVGWPHTHGALWYTQRPPPLSAAIEEHCWTHPTCHARTAALRPTNGGRPSAGVGEQWTRRWGFQRQFFPSRRSFC